MYVFRQEIARKHGETFKVGGEREGEREREREELHTNNRNSFVVTNISFILREL